MNTKDENDPATKASLDELVRQGVISEPTMDALNELSRQTAARLAKRPMVVDVVVKVVVSHRTPTQLQTEKIMTREAVAAVADAASKLTTVAFVSAEELEFDHCKWVYELGLPVTDGLPKPGRVDIFADGSWSFKTPNGVRSDAPGDSGRDLQSLARFILQIKEGGA